MHNLSDHDPYAKNADPKTLPAQAVAPAYVWLARLVGLALAFAIVQVMVSFAAVIPDYSYFNYWQYFTTQTNTVCACFIIYRWSPVYHRRSMSQATYEAVRAGLMLFMFFTTFVYWAVLHGMFKIPDPLTYFNVAYLHSAAFLYFILDYLAQPPRTRLSLKQLSLWLIYPAAYGVYIFTLAQFRPWYPYPFMNPKVTGSVGQVIINQIILYGLTIIVASIIRWVHNRWYERRLSVTGS
jgi:hypothetical protein